MMVDVKEYERENGDSPFANWFASLSAKAAGKIRVAIARIEAGNFGDHKSVGGGVWERRLDFEKGYRIYFGKDGKELVLLLGGGTKSRQQSDIANSKHYWAEYIARKKALAKNQESKSTIDPTREN